MSLAWLWPFVGLGSGVLIFFGGPILLGPSLKMETRERLAGLYFRLAQAAMERVLIVYHKTGGVTLHPSTVDSKYDLDRISINGENRWFDDYLGAMSTFKKRPLGFIDARFGLIINPKIAEYIEHRANQHDDERVAWKDEGGQRYMTEHVEVPKATQLVDIRSVARGLWGSFRPAVPDTVDTYVEKAHAGYESRDLVEDAELIMLFLVGFGVVWLAVSFGGGGGGGGFSNPVAGFGLTLVPDLGWLL